MQVCTLLQSDNHASTPPLSFLQVGCPSCHPNNSVNALKACYFNTALIRDFTNMIITKLHRTHRCSLFVTNVPFCVSMLAITMSCAEMDKPIKMSCGDVDLGGPRNHVVDGDPDPQGNGQFFCRGAPCDSDHLFYTPHRRLKTSHRMCCNGWLRQSKWRFNPHTLCLLLTSIHILWF